ncbi:MAG: FAD-binding oxidoreductase [bacterium]
MNIITAEASIVRIIQDTHCVKRYQLEFPELKDLNFQAGQFIILSLPEIKDEEDKPIKRAYSIASSPDMKDYLELCIKNMATGGLSTQLNDLQVGDKVNVQGPFGAFTLQHKQPKYIFLAGGSGISPLMSMVRHMAHEKRGEEILFFFSALTRCDLVYEEELPALVKEFPNIKLIFGISEEEWPAMFKDAPWEKVQGLFNKDTLAKYMNGIDYEAYICGPEPFINAMKDGLDALGVPKENVHYEDWGTANKQLAK